jgi:hypothetical protein
MYERAGSGPTGRLCGRNCLIAIIDAVAAAISLTLVRFQRGGRDGSVAR